MLAKLQETPEGFIRTWRDLLSIFWFLGPQFEPYVSCLAWDWWLKALYIRRSAPLRKIHLLDARIEEWLGYTVTDAKNTHRKYRAWLEREIGSTGDLGMRELPLAIEARLPAFRHLDADGKLPEISPSEAAVYEFLNTLRELEAAF